MWRGSTQTRCLLSLPIRFKVRTHQGDARTSRTRTIMKLHPFNLSLMTAVALTGWAMAADPATPSVGPDEALARLKAGNERFAKSKVSTGKPVAARRAETAKEQHPFAIVVACADSRSAPEIIFDQTIGDLFVIRTAGNLVDDYALGSIEYAVDHLGTRLIVVLGHERCGAVTAALGGGTAPGHINSLVRDIQPAVAASKAKEGDALTNAIHENDAEVAAKIRKQAQLGELASQVRVVEGYYDLDTGKVEWTAK
jgi:carbonic anhydrase